MLLIKNGTVINPADGIFEEQDILISDNIIQNIGKNLQESHCDKIIDAKGLMISPGLVDVHVHFREPGFIYKEDIETGAKAAAKGGFTTVVCMANTKPVVDNKEVLSYVIERGEKTDIHVLTAASVTEGLQGKQIVDMEQLRDYGAVGFTDDGMPLMDEAIVLAAMKEAARLNVPISFHEENPAYIEVNGINKGKISDKLGIGGSPLAAEIDLVKRDLILAEQTNVHINIQHISSKEAVELVRDAKKTNPNIHAEATPHHFALTEDAVLKYGTMAKMNPPLRTEEDRRAIIEALKDGTIDLIATDHAPHSAEEKAAEFKKAPSGILGLETALALGITHLVETGKMTYLQLLEKMTINPAKMYHLNAGSIEINAPADLMIFDPKETWMVTEFASKSKNSPFLGEKLIGKVKYTICNGKIVYQEKNSMPNQLKEMGIVKEQICIASDIYSMWIETSIAAKANPGQFISVYTKDKSKLLPRPISICEINQNKTMLRIVYRILGEGTKGFSEYSAGDTISVLGPLGNGFPMRDKKAFLIGGGIGIPPMLELAKQLKCEKQIIAGYRDEIFLKEELKTFGEVFIATEDGSAGTRGNVIDAIKENSLTADIIYACGPLPMLRAIKSYAREQGIEAYISLEEHMACGVGACLGCVCKTKEKDEHSHVNNARICKDGPVFLAEEVDI